MPPATSITPNSAAVVPVRFSAVDINDTSQMVKHILWSTIQTREHLGMHVAFMLNVCRGLTQHA